MAATSAAFSPKLSLIRRFSIHIPLFSSSSSSISLSRSLSPSTSLLLHYRPIRNPRVLAVAENENQTFLAEVETETEWESEGEEEEEEEEEKEEEKAMAGVVGASVERKRRARPCELYVCNLPRSYDISHLLELLKPYGTVLSVEVSRDPQTGISRGCGFVTMGSISEAKSAIAALDGSDVAGREMRVKFSVDMVSRRKNIEALNSAPKKSIIFESPYKIYIGNLSWSVKPLDLREHFSQFGTVVSTRVLHDRKQGKNRFYAFLSFSTPDEVLLATEANGSKFNGRIMLVREVINQGP